MYSLSGRVPEKKKNQVVTVQTNGPVTFALVESVLHNINDTQVSMV